MTPCGEGAHARQCIRRVGKAACRPHTPWKGLDKSVSTVPGCSNRAQIFCFLRASSFTCGRPHFQSQVASQNCTNGPHCTTRFATGVGSGSWAELSASVTSQLQAPDCGFITYHTAVELVEGALAGPVAVPPAHVIVRDAAHSRAHAHHLGGLLAAWPAVRWQHRSDCWQEPAKASVPPASSISYGVGKVTLDARCHCPWLLQRNSPLAEWSLL